MKKKSLKDLKIGDLKKIIRNKLLKKRNDLSVSEIIKRSDKIWKNIEKSSVYSNSHIIMFYASIGSEVKTNKMLEKAKRSGKKVVLPVAENKRHTISAYEICSRKDDTIKGSYGILEPDKKKCNRVKPEEIDLVFVPGLVFDKHGNRIGYGKGYYDRWLKKIDRPKRVGLAYSFQIVKKLPIELNDEKVGSIITEKGILKKNNNYIRSTK